MASGGSARSQQQAPATTQLRKRLLLDLPHPLARHTELLADFLQGMLPLVADAESQHDDAPLALVQRIERREYPPIPIFG